MGSSDSLCKDAKSERVKMVLSLEVTTKTRPGHGRGVNGEGEFAEGRSYR
jgi:hypothetical protein